MYIYIYIYIYINIYIHREDYAITRGRQDSSRGLSTRNAAFTSCNKEHGNGFRLTQHVYKHIYKYIHK